MAATTDDCKRFLAAFFTQNPGLAVEIFVSEDETDPDELWNLPGTLRADIVTPAKWKRRAKRKSGRDHYTVYDPDRRYPRGPHYGGRRVPADRFVLERAFFLDEAVYDSAVGFLVLEDRDGTLHLGNYVGD